VSLSRRSTFPETGFPLLSFTTRFCCTEAGFIGSENRTSIWLTFCPVGLLVPTISGGRVIVSQRAGNRDDLIFQRRGELLDLLDDIARAGILDLDLELRAADGGHRRNARGGAREHERHAEAHQHTSNLNW